MENDAVVTGKANCGDNSFKTASSQFSAKLKRPGEIHAVRILSMRGVYFSRSFVSRRNKEPLPVYVMGEVILVLFFVFLLFRGNSENSD